MKYRKKPVVIEAVQFTGDNLDEIQKFAGENVISDTERLIIFTLEDGEDKIATHVADPGDFIIKGIQGEFYPCKPDIFWATYEVVGTL